MLKAKHKSSTTVLSVILAVLIAFSSVAILGGVNGAFGNKASAAASATKVYSKEYYYAPGTKFVSYMATSYATKLTTRNDAKSLITDRGYTLFDVDFNDGAGGNWIYAGYKMTTDISKAARSIVAGSYDSENNKYADTKTFNGSLYTVVGISPASENTGDADGVVDLNRGASGNYIYLYISKDPKAGAPITGIDFTEDTDKSGVTYVVGSPDSASDVGSPADLNRGCGGSSADTVLYYSSITTTVNSDLLRAAYKEAETLLAKSSNYISVTALQNAYNAASICLTALNNYGASTYDQSAIQTLTDDLNNAMDALQISVAFNGNGGTTTVSPIAVTIGRNATASVKVTTAATASKECYNFLGWSLNKNDTSGLKSGTFTVKPGDTFYAIYTPYTYYVSYNGNGATAGTMAKDVFFYDTSKALSSNNFGRAFTVNYDAAGGTASKTSDSAKSTFKGWATSATGTVKYADGASVLNLTKEALGTVELYAIWADTTVTLPSVAKDGYTFKGWYTAANGGTLVGTAGTTYAPTAATVTLYAQYSVNAYTVNFKNEDGTLLQSGSYDYGVKPTYEGATPVKAYDDDNHYTFSGWTPAVVKVTGEATYTAQFTATAHSYTSSDTKTATCMEKGIRTYTCTCGKTYTEEIGLADHSYGAYIFDPVTKQHTRVCSVNTAHKETADCSMTVVTNEATCTTDGSKVYTCSVCNGVVTETLVSSGHVDGEAAVENNVDATCKVPGSYDLVVRCVNCKEVISSEHFSNTTVPHTPGEPKESGYRAPTCSAKGRYTTTIRCSVCDATLSSVVTYIDKLPHTEGAPAIENEKEGTCIKAGSYDTVVRCTVCKTAISRETTTTEKAPHTTGTAAKENEKAATCIAKASYDMVVRCTVCKEALSIETVEYGEFGACVPAAAVTEDYVAPSCTEKGSYNSVVYCSVCGDKLSSEPVEVDMVAHKAKAAVQENVVDATCTSTGSYDSVIYCAVCNTEMIRTAKTIALAKHTPGEVTVENEKEGTCKTKASYDNVVRCTVCNAVVTTKTVYTTYGTHTPDEAQISNEKAPTCAAEGSYIETITCSVCRKILSKLTKTIPALDHTPGEAQIEDRVEPTCTTSGGYNTVVRCTVCNGVVSSERTNELLTGHTDEDGDKICDDCGMKLRGTTTDDDGDDVDDEEVCDICGYKGHKGEPDKGIGILTAKNGLICFILRILRLVSSGFEFSEKVAPAFWFAKIAGALI